eukprot:scaffold91348_cov14-Tisochrysis_lutea.AAC.1
MGQALAAWSKGICCVQAKPMRQLHRLAQDWGVQHLLKLLFPAANATMSGPSTVPRTHRKCACSLAHQ